MTALAVLLCALAIVFGFTYKHYNDRIAAELARDCEYVSSGLLSYGEGYLDTVSIEGVRIVLLSRDGEVVFDSDANSAEAETVSFSKVLTDGRILKASSAEPLQALVLTEMLGTALILFVLITLIALFASKRLSHSIVKPINSINLDSPDGEAVYDELKPMVNRLSQQRYRISRQLAELRMKEEEFSSITANMREGIMVINDKTDILSANEAARSIFKIKGQLPKSILAVKDTESFRVGVASALRGELGYDTIRTEDKFYSINISPVVSDFSVEGAVVLVIDDTEKEARERLRREFTSNVSHELKTPLTSILGFAELIRSGVTSAEESSHFADNIHREASRLIVLVGDIIQLTRLDGAEMPYDDEPVRLDEIAVETVERLENLARAAEVTLECEHESVDMPGNSQIVSEIIYNLADNAIKYNKRGGWVKIRVFYDASEAVVSVCDNGIGIPADKQDRVFERFYRVDKSHSKDIGGTGLGLSIVKHSAAYHKAKITLKSVQNEGTEIEVRFPALIQK